MARSLSVMLVDDDPASLTLLRGIVELMGFRATALESPGEALRRMGEASVDLLITDLRMPEMSGIELLQAARAARPELCVLVITGFAGEETTAEAFQAGAWDFLLKPINLTEAQARIGHAAEVVQLRQEVQALRKLIPPDRAAPAADPAAPRARELEDLPALPGSAAPIEMAGREESQRRPDRLVELYRQAGITIAEDEESERG
jgi:DNA-binding NtrC family response regulator